MRETIYEKIAANKRRTYFFIFIFTLILAIIGYVIIYIFNFGSTGIALLALFIIGYNLILYFNADKIALSLSRAVPADPDEYQILHNVVEEMAIAGGIPKPKVFVIDEEAPNAFATGRNPQNASVAVTTGLLRIMNREELQGVIAHEISHIRHYDILLMTVVGIIGGMIILLRDIMLRGGFLSRGQGRSRSRVGGRAGAILVIVGLVLAILAPLFVALLR
ncbi:MAG: M48 family metalloprotease, partial [candidate division WOR-3 bacterium]